MKTVKVDFNQITGIIKPMHATNNGPGYSVRNPGKSAKLFTDAGIPYIRNHDAAFAACYGGEHTVDVENIFSDFSKDENDPKNYDFLLTDQYMQACNEAGCKILYRLGSKIEHEAKKYHTNVPKDFMKYARVCEHIIKHLCYGWADGLNLDIPYWEIWNEADGYNEDGSNACWQGTIEQFYVFYETLAKYLKDCFPDLKIGGPAYTKSTPSSKYSKDFIRYMSEHKVPLDFFSWHGYYSEPLQYVESIEYTRELLNKYGYENTELVLDEWNYVRGWRGDDIR